LLFKLINIVLTFLLCKLLFVTTDELLLHLLPPLAFAAFVAAGCLVPLANCCF